MCGRAMRMDGIFEGELFSTGSITIGPTGSVIGNLKGLDFLRVEGEVRRKARLVALGRRSLYVMVLEKSFCAYSLDMTRVVPFYFRKTFGG